MTAHAACVVVAMGTSTPVLADTDYSECRDVFDPLPELGPIEAAEIEMAMALEDTIERLEEFNEYQEESKPAIPAM